MYNPFSLLYYFKNEYLSNYWFESGTPSFLIKLLQAQCYDLENIKDLEGTLLTAKEISSIDIENPLLMHAFLLTGYLTIKDYNSVNETYTLGIPNEEVKESFEYLESRISPTKKPYYSHGYSLYL